MKILLLTQVLPHPADSGPKVKTAAVLRYLSQHHEVTLVSFTRGDQSEDVRFLRPLCEEVHTVPIQRGLARDAWYMGRSLLTGESFLMARDARAAMHRLVGELARRQRFDIAHADQLNMAQYVDVAHGRGARILDAHNALWLVTERLARNLPAGPRRMLLQREVRLLKRYEGRVCREFEGVLAVSEEDRAALRQAAEAATEIALVPIAIDVTRPPIRRHAEADRLLHIGSLIWPPSVDGLLWFLREVLPRIQAQRPSQGLDIVGGNPPAEVAAYGERDSRVRVHGYVADPTPLLASAGVMVVPLRAGGGMRVRILNALAQGIPMVTTSIGCEGIAVEHGRDLLIADEPQAFADAVLRLLDDREQAASLARAGRCLVEERYDFRVVCRTIDEVYRSALAKRGLSPGKSAS